MSDAAASPPTAAADAPAPVRPPVGATATYVREVTDAVIRQFADATGDHNAIHLDEAAAARSRFGGRIAHGMLSAGFVSAALATVLPGPGVIYREQSLRFLLPVRIGDVITVRLAVIELPGRARVRLSTVCTNQRDEVVLEGEAVVTVPE